MCDGRRYYPASWALLSLISLVLAICVGTPLPSLSPASRPIWLGCSIPIATFLYLAIMYALCWRHVLRVEECMSQGLRPAVAAPTKEVRRLEKIGVILISETEQLKLDIIHAHPQAVTFCTNSPLAD